MHAYYFWSTLELPRLVCRSAFFINERLNSFENFPSNPILLNPNLSKLTTDELPAFYSKWSYNLHLPRPGQVCVEHVTSNISKHSKIYREVAGSYLFQVFVFHFAKNWPSNFIASKISDVVLSTCFSQNMSYFFITTMFLKYWLKSLNWTARNQILTFLLFLP